MKNRLLGVLSVVLVLSMGRSVLGEVRVAHIFADGAVLQRDKAVRIWGWGDASEKVTVTFAEQIKKTVVDKQGQWLVALDVMKESFQGRNLIVEGQDNKVVVKDVLVGEVWLCGGQSNMEWSLRASRDADMEMDSVNYPAMRFIKLPHIARMHKQEDFPVESSNSPQGNWRRCTPVEVENCTAVGYYFGRRLHRRLNVPVGLIDTSWGGTMAQHWVSKERLRGFEAMKTYFEKFHDNVKAWNDGGGEEGAKKRYEADMKEWQQKRDEAKAKGLREPRRPNSDSYSNPAYKRQPGGMFNGMIAPLSKLSIRGVLFYQGENNSFTDGWKPFPQTFPAVIADWRSAFADEDLPFGIIQIAGWSTRRSMTYDMNHHTNIVREVQFITWKRTPGTGLIVTFDTNSNRSIHPGHKLPVGERSARWALSEVYGVKQWRSDKALQWRGPVYESIAVQGDKIIVSFEEGTQQGLRLDQDDECGFYIAGKERQFHHARARVVENNKVQVWSEDVGEAVAVRYGWSNLPAGGLMNARELPAYPFRSDNWPLVPHQSTGAYEVDK